MVGQLEVLQKQRKWAEEIPTKEEIINTFLLTEGCMGKTDHQLATKERKLDSVRYTLKRAKLGGLNENMFPPKDVSEQNVLLLASKRGRAELPEEVWEQCEEKQRPEDLKQNLVWK